MTEENYFKALLFAQGMIDESKGKDKSLAQAYEHLVYMIHILENDYLNYSVASNAAKISKKQAEDFEKYLGAVLYGLQKFKQENMKGERK